MRSKFSIRTAIAEEVRAQLVERFPLCFMPKGAEKRPLKIGIRADLYAVEDLGITRARLKVALYDYTRGLKYARNVVEGTERIDLSGASAGLVTADDARSARFHVERLEGLYKAERQRRAA
jgi:ProP effector